MKGIKIIPIAISLLLLIYGSASYGKSITKTVRATQQESHSHHTTENIKLNNGKKWKVDENMLIHIRNMEKDVAGFKKIEPSNYQFLAKMLKQNIRLLTSNCTMKGKAHDELHKWLLPYIDLVRELSIAKDETEGERQFQKIENSFKTFNQYFQ